MPLIKSISGIRGTIGGVAGENLTPYDIVKYAVAYAQWLKNTINTPKLKVVIGRDARISGSMVKDFVINTLIASGIDVVDTDLSTTPTVEMAVVQHKADGGIIITASHNPAEWNALKLLNNKGEFLNGEDGSNILTLAENNNISFAGVDKLGVVSEDDDSIGQHIEAILNYELVDKDVIAGKNFKVVIDAINSTGALAVAQLLEGLGVTDFIILNDEMNGRFAHNPEPLPQNLSGLVKEVTKQNAHLGIAVDPDVDRLCFVCEDGSLFGEEYTLVAVADYVLQHRKGNTVSNLSSTKALKDVTLKHGGEYHPSAVGEVNVVEKMKEVNAVVGGEGNGGIIIPDFHYGRDALIGIALFLTHLAKSNKTTLQLRKQYPDYFISKNKIELDKNVDVKKVLSRIHKKYKNQPVNTEDGLRIEFDNDWVHLRSSNTEPIIRIYSESSFATTADNIAFRLMQDIKENMKNSMDN